jgi:hypothetical protein
MGHCDDLVVTWSNAGTTYVLIGVELSKWGTQTTKRVCPDRPPRAPRADQSKRAAGVRLDATYDGGVTLRTRFVLPDPVRRRRGDAE